MMHRRQKVCWQTVLIGTSGGLRHMGQANEEFATAFATALAKPRVTLISALPVASVSFILVAERFWSEPDQERPPAHVARSDCLEGTMRLAVAICGLMLLIGGAHVLGRGRA